MHFGWLLGFVLTCIYPSQSQANAQDNPIQIAQSTWLVFGDSLSAAYGMDKQQGWVALLQQELQKTGAHVQVVNASISGETTSGGKQRLPALLQQYHPQRLVLELGANDALRGQDLHSTQQNLQAMISACVQYNKDCQVVLLGVRLPTNYGPAYDGMFQAMYQDLADNNRVLFDAFFLETVVEDPGLMQWDGLHPNAAAQPLILQRVWPLLEPNRVGME
jgi:acyl-CoA thioesterase-1